MVMQIHSNHNDIILGHFTDKFKIAVPGFLCSAAFCLQLDDDDDIPNMTMMLATGLRAYRLGYSQVFLEVWSGTCREERINT